MSLHQQLKENFERVVIISLPNRADRRRQAVDELERLGVQVDGNTVLFFDAVRPEAAGAFPSIGAHGCFMSHLGVLERCASEKTRSVLILEDDFMFVREGRSKLNEILLSLNSLNWDVFYGGHRISPDAYPPASSILFELAPEVRVETSHCVGLAGEAIPLASTYLRDMLSRPAGSPNGGPMHVDGAYSWFRRSNDRLTTLVASPAVVNQRPSRSDIFEDLAWFDRIRLIAPLITAARQAKRQFWSR